MFAFVLRGFVMRYSVLVVYGCFFWLIASVRFGSWLTVGFALSGFAGVCFYLGLISLCLGCFVCLCCFWLAGEFVVCFGVSCVLIVVLDGLYFALFVV